MQLDEQIKEVIAGFMADLDGMTAVPELKEDLMRVALFELTKAFLKAGAAPDTLAKQLKTLGHLVTDADYNG